jgi:hypothetical protein
VTILSGHGTRTIQLSLPSGFTNVQIGVYASNCVGASNIQYKTLFGLPVINTGLTGPIYLCPSSTQTYSVGAATGATSYSWSITGNAQIISSSGPSAVVQSAANWTGGVITVAAVNSCGSNPRSFTLYSRPLQPGAITGPAFNLCNAAGVNQVTYSIAPVAGATSYNWTVPAGMTIVGLNTGTTISVLVGSSFTGTGAVCVSAIGNCGAGTARCLTVSSRPPAPGAITGPSAPCKSTSNAQYSIPAMPNITTYQWQATGNAYVFSNSFTSATVDYNFVTSPSVTISVNAVNACGSGAASRLAVTVNMLCRESQLSDWAGQQLVVYPNPSNGKVIVGFDGREGESYTVLVTDMFGRAVITNEMISSAEMNSTLLDLSNEAKGIYMVTLRSADGSRTETVRLVLH